MTITGDVPGPLKGAVALMYTAAGIQLIGLIITLAATSPNGIKATAVLLNLMGIGTWVWMALMNRAGNNWARITGTVFFGIECVIVLYVLGAPYPPGTKVGDVILWIIALIIVILLWNRANAAYFGRD